jgi:membrane-anchored mycosin MYCP
MRVRAVALAMLATVIVAAVPMMASGPAQAEPTAQPYQLYYTVTSAYQGKPETLFEIATRFLGDSNRAGDILGLNSTRTQPDGARLTDPATLHAGWQLVMPWDAIGSELHYGVMPTVTVKPKPTVASNPPTPPVSPVSPTPPVGKTAAPPVVGGKPTSKPPTKACIPVKNPAIAWGQQQLDPARIWTGTTGQGIRLAIVDSGVDGTNPALNTRVAAGADIVSGSGRGDTDCLGTGTTMALVAAGDDGAGGKKFGIAPKATIIPIRLTNRTPGTTADRAATAIQVAVSTGAQVIALGTYVDVANPAVRKAVDNAIGHNVVVVMPVRPAGKNAVAGAEDGLLRVGGVRENRNPAAKYPSNSVDLVAPGNAREAAAYVAGAVVLVRANHPGLGATEAAKQVLRTATAWQPVDRYGAGLVSPYDAIVRPLPVGVQHALDTPVPPSDDNDAVLGTIVLIVAIVLVALLIVGLGLRQMRMSREARAARDRANDSQDDPFNEKLDSGQLTGSKS